MNQNSPNQKPGAGIEVTEVTMATQATIPSKAGSVPVPAAPSKAAGTAPMPPTGARVPSADQSLLQSGQMLGKCRIEKLLGRGGMGAVYLARHTTLDVPVAVKVMLPEVSRDRPDFAERFMREAKLASRIRHANVIQVMDAALDEKSGLYYIIQEFIDGGTVRDLMRRGALTEGQALDIIAGVAAALAAAADYNIVHRDIKPDNIMLTRKGEVKLADLGIAKECGEDAGLTVSQVMMGTPAYVAPEQARDAKNVDARADIYSLGATLYHMLCGAPPYVGDTTYSVLSKLISEPTPDPRGKRPDLAEPVAKLVMRMMAKEAAQRPQTAAALLEEIKLVRGEGASATDMQRLAMTLMTEMKAMRDEMNRTGIGTSAGTPIPSAAVAVPAGKKRLIWAVSGLLALILVMLAIGQMMKNGKEADDILVNPPSVKTPGSGVAVVPPATTPGSGVAVVPPVTTPGTGIAVVPPVTTPGTGVAVVPPATTPGTGIAVVPVVPPAPVYNVAALQKTLDGMLAKALDPAEMDKEPIKNMLANPVCYVGAKSQAIEADLVVKELVAKRVKIKDVFALLGKPRVGIDIKETVVGKDGIASRESKIDRFRTAMKNQLEKQYDLFVVDVTGERADQKAQCDILITGDVEVAFFAEAVPPEIAAMGGTTVVISYNTGVKVRFLNAVTNQDLDSSIMDFEPKGNTKYMGMSQADAMKKSVQGAIDTLLPDWLKKIETGWVNLRIAAAGKPVMQ